MFGRPKASRVSVEYTGADANDIIGNGCAGGRLGAMGDLLALVLLVAFLLMVWK